MGPRLPAAVHAGVRSRAGGRGGSTRERNRMKDRQLSGTASDDDVLSNYLHSHIVAAASGVRLFERAARVWKDSPHGTTLDQLRADVAADKAELESMAHQLGLGVPPSKRALAWT